MKTQENEMLPFYCKTKSQQQQQRQRLKRKETSASIVYGAQI